MIIQHDILAMNAARQLGIATKTKAKRTERLSSGYRINRSADDAASLAISEKMRAQIRGLQKGTRNVQEAIGFCNVADGALNEVHNILDRVKELAVQAASDTYVLEDREAIEAEFKQLKEEINRISKTTEYNTMRIFDDGEFKIEFSDEYCPIKIFNANHGDPNDPDTYGGIILANDERIAWKSIDPKMVYVDPDSNETMFREGEYKYKGKGYELTISCEEGSKPPEIKVEFEVSAGGNGIMLAGSVIRWEDVINDDGESILEHIGEEGWYHFRDRQGEGGFYVEEGATLADIIKGLNNYNEKTHRRYYNVYDGYYTSQAVDMEDVGTKMQVSQDIYDNCIKIGKDVELNVILQADDTGIWAIDKNGNELTNSKKTWEELGLKNWSSTNDVSDQKVYKYSYQSPDNKMQIEFEFFLLDETSKESVIEGIHGVEVKPETYIVNNKTDMELVTVGTNISSGKIVKSMNAISFKEEGEFGREFDVQKKEFAEAKLSYDSTTDKITAEFESLYGTGKKLTYETTMATTPTELEKSAEISMQYLMAKAVQKAMSVSGPFDTIADVLGAGKITDTGYFSEVYTTNADTIKTSDLGNGTFAAASMDFSDLGISYQLYDLLGTGFDSTCMTCNNHYSVMFVYGGTNQTTSSGYGFSKSVVGNDHYLQIDLKTMMEKGIATGEDFTKALVEVLDDSNAHFDYHYTQYATDTSGKLYICDNRPEYVGKTIVQEADFYVQPYNVKEVDVKMRLQNKDDSRYIELSYSYDISSEIVNDISANMIQENTNGLYVKDGSGKWKLYNPSDYYDNNGNLLPGMSVPDRFNIEVVDNINWNTVYDTVMQTIANQTTLSLKTTDYAFIDCDTEEKPNEAYVSKFRFRQEEDEDDGMWIQAGPNKLQGLFMRWDGFSSHYLGLSYLSMTDREDAETLIRRADKAIEKISGIRSAFGAYTNRLEKIYDMNQNYQENLQAAESKLRDADMAAEVMENAKAEILQQVSQAMMSQANQSKQAILSLLQG